MPESKSHSESTEPGLIDTHAHLGLDPLGRNPGSVIRRAAAAGVSTVITIGIDPDQAVAALQIAERFERVFAVVGIHPHNAKSLNDGRLIQMEHLARHPKVVGYGETGLDFFRDYAPRDMQIGLFEDQIQLAKKLEKPLVIHLRSAYRKGLDLLEQAAPFPRAGVVHCFSGDEGDAIRALDLGFYLSIPGTITYKGNDKLRSLVRTLPHDRILLETDCPFLAPVPMRGGCNEPAFLVHTAHKMAEVLGLSLHETARITTQNAKRLFGLDG
jgi:TatD DNase family protein